jgi:hypothetical protein
MAHDDSGNGGLLRHLQDRISRSKLWSLFSDRGPDRAARRFTGSGDDQPPPVSGFNSSGHSR